MKQPGRKLFHLVGGALLIAVFVVVGPPWAFAAYALIFTVTLALDSARLAVPGFNRWALAALGSYIRPGEAATFTGIPSYVAGVALTFGFFEPRAALLAILLLVVGDVSASIVGERWGRRRVGPRSLEGTAAFAAAGTVAALCAGAAGAGPAPFAAAAGVASGTLTELFAPAWLNDNLAIPLVSASVMTLASALV